MIKRVKIIRINLRSYLRPSASNSKGQVMLITSLVLSSTLLGATTIAGLLMLYQLRQGSDIANSTKAIYAADAGIEWRLYRFFKADNQSCDCSGENCAEPEFSNGAELSTTCVANPIEGGGQEVLIRSRGISQKNARAFEFNFTVGN